jgi:single-strand DNA-binding protein
VTLVGFVAQDPNIRTTATGKLVTRVRVGTTPRFRDSATGQWRDAETSYFNVSCWSRLADHVRASLHKGDPVIVKGRFKTSSFEDKNGQLRTSIEITADTVGHDLSRGPANYMRPRTQHANTEGGAAGGASAENPENPDSPEGPDEMIDEEAIERFGRDLDEADLAARALTEDQEGGEAAEAAVPPLPAAPF